MIPLEQAQEEILSRISPLGSVEVPLDEAAHRFLARPVVSLDEIPPFDNSAMDGFALRSADVASATEESPVQLAVTSVIEAGAAPSLRLESGEAGRIYTGAPIPAGADCILPFERAARFDDTSVVVAKPIAAGAHVRRRGSDVSAGTVVLEVGQRLTPAAIGLLANVGCARVEVGRRPRVAVHSTGNELVGVDEPLAPGKIRNSNLYSLVARLEEWGAVPLRRPVLRDTMDEVRSGLRQTLTLRPDAIVTTGGISAGDLDYVREVARELGDDVEVRRVAMKPGKPLVYGLISGVPFFGLPGNPAACLVSFEVFVRPALARLEGRPDGAPPRVTARITRDHSLPSSPRVQMVRAHVHFDAESGEYHLAPPGSQGSHLLSSFADANCLAVVPPGQSELRENARLEVMLLR